MNLMISAATHRMGSTLLQRMFNARKETLIWGENGASMKHFLKIYNNLMHWAKYSRDSGEYKNYFGSDEDPNNWIANLTPDIEHSEKAIVETIRDFYTNLYWDGKHDFIGFKEVRYGSAEIELFRKCFPEAFILLLVRNPFDTYKSIISMSRNWYGNVESFVDTYNKRVNEYKTLKDKYIADIILIKYEDLIARKLYVIEMIKKMGYLTDEQIDYVMSIKLGAIGSSSINKLDLTDYEDEYIACNTKTDFYMLEE